MKQVLDAKGVISELITVPSGHSSQMIKKHPEVVDKTLKFIERIIGKSTEQNATTDADKPRR